MPNHVTHICTVHGDCAAVFALAFSPPTGEGDDADADQVDLGFDCGKIVPKPAIIDKTESGTNSDWGLSLIGVPGKMPANSPHWTREKFDARQDHEKEEIIAKTLASVEALLRTGYANWYDWSVANWGTKWGAYAQSWTEPTANQREWTFTFDTAWSPPEPVFAKLATMLPQGTSIRVEWRDEGGPVGAYLLEPGPAGCVEVTPEYVWPSEDEDEEEDA